MTPDPWNAARKFTSARIALGRAGGSLPTAAWLSFAGDHAAARDAVYAELDVETLMGVMVTAGVDPAPSPGTPGEGGGEGDLRFRMVFDARNHPHPSPLPGYRERGPESVLRLDTLATDRATYLRRPDLGRRLSPASAAAAAAASNGPVDIALIVADGLSAIAAQSHAATVLKTLIPALQARVFSIAPLSVVTQARVAVQDEIGQLLQAKVAVILIGERPGLAAADSLGAYLVHNPGPGRTDADRNCVSNIRPDGMPPHVAAELIFWLIEQAMVRRISGVGLKDERTPHFLTVARAPSP